MSGVVLGEDQDAPAFHVPEEPPHPLHALELAVLPALRRPPCLVSFSGGRDSSAVLAVATRVARREGLDDPVPLTFRYPDAPSAQESEWQELAVRELRVREWRRQEIGEDLDLVGPVARRLLRRYGVLYPANMHIQLARFEQAGGASLLTGHGGDHVLGGWPWGRRNARRAARAIAPRVLRARRLRDRAPRLPWLTRQAAAQIAEGWAAERASEPIRWDSRTAWVARRRDLTLSTTGAAALAADHHVRLMHPLLDPGFLAAVAVHGGRRGFPSRVAAMEELFSEVLPPRLLARKGKAHFGEVLWSRHSRAFIERWDGRGVPNELVDEDALRREWAEPAPHFGTAMLLQSAWLASDEGGPC